ncbi:MAG: hypothetical protein M1816_005558 [Peltula sp. TS41687]|nr:MAG: hypothetical protein M1816_005558 [Peltula sp. TS41687]
MPLPSEKSQRIGWDQVLDMLSSLSKDDKKIFIRSPMTQIALASMGLKSETSTSTSVDIRQYYDPYKALYYHKSYLCQ